ncbi:carotenoid biosynthesis protein [Anaerococcus sp. Marseille-P9784]|uniref:carotenoid biosynthesis protein n=1 Tax=Anaerococcus sp. Marseille-P9784 TaxID=2614127 RepID=UPI00124A3235|nr:carotenoid biosynthesis protein [Anaerococcus sp. Marseille-P9784]
MNWINTFEILCYIIVAILFVDILKNKNYKELSILISGCLAGFALELLAVRFTSIYHYSNDFYLSIGIVPYQFPLFGGLMWGAITVCALRIALKFDFDKLMTALLTGFLIVSMDLLLDVIAIRLDGGFWIWEGRVVDLTINHHTFMSVLWVNFLGYMFEVPAIVYMSLTYFENIQYKNHFNLLKALIIGFFGVVFVSLASAISLFFNKITDEWFSFVAFVILYIFIFIRFAKAIISSKNILTFKGNKDYPLIIFWVVIYTYCICGLIKLEILQTKLIYGIFSILLAVGTIILSLVCRKDKNINKMKGQ